MTPALALEQLRIRVFGYLPRWVRARRRGMWSGVFATGAYTTPEQAIRWDGELVPTALDFAALGGHVLTLPPRHGKTATFSASYVMTPVGPMPREMYERIVPRLRRSLDDRNDWMDAIRRSEP